MKGSDRLLRSPKKTIKEEQYVSSDIAFSVHATGSAAGDIDFPTSICEILEDIDFTTSKLPSATLQQKTDDRQCLGDFEYTTQFVCYKLREDRRDYTSIPRIDEFDQLLKEVVLKYADYIHLGRVNASIAARNAVVCGFCEIRMELPTIYAGLGSRLELETYINDCIAYIRRHLQLIDYAASYDIAEENTKRAQNMYIDLEAEIYQLQDEIERDLTENAEIIEDFAVLMQAMSSSELTSQQNALRLRLIDLGVKKTVCSLWETVWRQRKLLLGQMAGRLDVLRVEVSRVPNPDYSERIDEAISAMTKGLIEDDEKLRQAHDQWLEAQEHISSLTRSHQGQKLTDESIKRTVDRLVQKQKDADPANNARQPEQIQI